MPCQSQSICHVNKLIGQGSENIYRMPKIDIGPFTLSYANPCNVVQRQKNRV